MSDEEAFKEAYKGMSDNERALYRTYKVKLPKEISVETAIANLNRDPDIGYAEPNLIVKPVMTPNDPYYTSGALWGVTKMRCEKAWNISQGQDVIVALIDTGVDYNHPDICNNIYRDINGKIISNVPDPMDTNGHGTHCAGIIAATGNNGIGVIGVAPRVRIMPIRGVGPGLRPGSGSLMC